MLARDMMHDGAECVGEHASMQDVAVRMRDLDVGCMPICGDDDKLHGIITDRDIVLRCCAEGRDPATMTAGEMAQGTLVWISADATEDQVLALMTRNRIKRLPVIDDGRLVGMISEADVARHLSDDKVAQMAEAIYADR
ncbi:CBS domain-containing protein [Nitriliruptor alkaliphilus]|uniref:CBS domain-containing protein n=1 Tax=Nitriliruptor alkaliphilus TaxID=427918 RepID=UPI0006973C5E|nr:CBS domain-containing protein [Nitriliruptor alkaliphilus]